MNLEQDEWLTLSTLLDEALAIAPQQRQAWLDARTDIAPKLLSLAHGLIEPQTGSFTLPAMPAYSDAELHTLGPADAMALAPGMLVGPYRLLRELGRGGMGTVWLASRSDAALKREVALKLPHSTLSQQQLTERFARERDILAALVHPHIARLYDAGLMPDGRPYLALEYVDGEPLGSYCTARQLGSNARLELFLQVLAAVQYAHNQLVVHRDLKPSNVLVTSDGQARLLDFGIAKLLTDGQAMETELTQVGGRALTPQYAAPEQLLGQTISTAVDVYALGVMLYELLTGALPYRPKRDSRGALEDAILDADVLPPSRAPLTGPASKALRRTLRGDLDTIVLKALKKEPQARYATVAAFADDVQRYLRGEPVLARPDSALYRTGKFLRRNRWSVAAASVLLVSLSGASAFSLWQAQVAQKEARTASAVKEFMQGIFLANTVQQPDPQRARQTTARELLDIGAGKLDAGLNQAPEAKLEMLKMFSELYSQLALTDRSVVFAQQYVTLTRRVHGANSQPLAEALLMLAAALRGASPDHPQIGATIEEAGTVLGALGDASAELQGVHAVLAAEYYADRDFRRASAYAHQAAELLRQASESSDISMVLGKAAKIDLQAGDCASARALAIEGIAAANAETAKGQAGQGGNTALPLLFEVRGRADWCLGDLPAAEARLRQAYQSSQTIFGDTDTETLRIQARLADLLLASGRNEQGNALLENAALTLGRHDRQDKSRLHIEALASVGAAQLRAGRNELALANLSQVLNLRSGVTASPAVAEVLRDSARALLALKRPAPAAQALEQAVAMRAKSGLQSEKIDLEEKSLRQQALQAGQ